MLDRATQIEKFSLVGTDFKYLFFLPVLKKKKEQRKKKSRESASCYLGYRKENDPLKKEKTLCSKRKKEVFKEDNV